MKIFVGYDAREHLCFQTLEHNLWKFGHEVIPIRHRELRAQGKFSRPWLIDEDGQYHDQRDGKPFSTEFSHARFAAIPMARIMGLDEWCLFVDVDFLFRDDPAKILTYVDKNHAIGCTQYNWQEPEGKKMDGMLQLLYYRKLWSCIFAFNPQHPAHDWLTWHRINWETGASLHAFSWIEDEQVSEIPPEWNYIPNFTDTAIDAKAVHWSYGGPWMPNFKYVEYADEWRAAYDEALVYMVENQVALDVDLVADGRII